MLQTPLRLSTFLLLVAVLTACGEAPSGLERPSAVVPTSQEAANQTAPGSRRPAMVNYGTTTDRFGEVINPEAQRRFLEAYEAGRPGRWEHITYTVEGDPIYERLFYAGGGKALRRVVDMTEDQFSAPEDRVVREYECERLERKGKRLRLVRCSGQERVMDFELPAY